MKDIKGFENEYAITEDGKVWSYKSKKYIAPTTTNSGYAQVRLCKGGKYSHLYVHRLVAIAYIPNSLNLPQVNHIDENKLNNTVDNLEWCDAVYNNNYGTGKVRAGEKHHKPIYCVELGREFPSVKGASDELNISYCQLSLVLTGKYRNKTCGGYHWKYL